MLVELQTQSLVELHNTNITWNTNTKFSGTTQHKDQWNYTTQSLVQTTQNKY